MSLGGSGTLHSAVAERPSTQKLVVGSCAALAALLLGLSALHAETVRAPLLALVGLALGFVLFQSSFGFAGSFKALIERGDATGFRAQALALALSSIVFFPLLAGGSVFGQPLYGFVAPIGFSFAFGAVLFGMGMQLGGGCASGTLFMLGGGNAKLLLTLTFFILGSVLGAAHIGFWQSLPAFAALTSQDLFGWPLALALHLIILSLVFLKAKGEKPLSGATGGFALKDMASKPWPLLWGAIALAGLNGLTLVLAGRPWGETAGFTLWGSKLIAYFGIDPSGWTYWQGHAEALQASLFSDITSIMDFGIIIGAALAAGLSRRFVLRYELGRSEWIGAVAGGLLMGYGARLSDGCNIGAYFSALASGSVSGWVWVVFAYAGSVIGLRLKASMRGQ